AHPWFLENAITTEHLRADLLTRKVQVEEEKRKEREQKRQSAAKQMDHEEEFDPFNMDVMRSVASSVASSIVSEPGSGDAYAPLYPKDGIALYTSFQSKSSPAEVQEHVERALSDVSARYVTKKNRFKTKVEMKTEDVGFAVRIYSLANTPDRCIVEFRRTHGNCFKFQEAYRKLSLALADLVWDDKIEVNDDAATERESGEELISDEAMMI
uniref:Non-specific serine/threonine protein kinase n=1 Tax=Globisporangium ultimum (strain ATCC 200006 / CBS 805.95 / DAOM BR144) TaxID=431595 RepID=K3X8F0_GLOUD